ncbi:MAG TPA: NADP-specific glutamate dehydrogenase [Gemmatimonadota bacterium]|nr:NADP-specific glutamate dehydrogenase [Gemmatimonadota bacterium]
MELSEFMSGLIARNGGEPEFHQAVREVAESVLPVAEANPGYVRARILERMTEPDRIIVFRVAWEDDDGRFQVNRGYRVQFNNAIGPYKGGLRFDPSVNLSVLKFLGFEQTLKNSLTTLPMGGAKGGADFNPKGRSDDEVMRFCQSFMTGLFRYIGEDVDVPAGDIGVGAREIGYLFGQYKRLQNEFTSAITGKGAAYGGSLLRTEATGYGCVYFAREMLATRGEGLEGKACVISGSGNVAQYTAAKLIELGARVLTLSDRDGFIHEPEGITRERLDWIIELKTRRHGSLAEYAAQFGDGFHAGEKPWRVPAQLAFPCATQNEVQPEDARALVAGGCIAVTEGANMPVSPEAAHLLREAGVLYAPGKAANAGGVAISGLEMTQNAMRLSWTREEVDRRLQEIIHTIHEKCVEHGVPEPPGSDRGRVDYVKGANVAGFLKVADAMLAYGVL